MSNLTSPAPAFTTGFNPAQSPDSTQSISVNYLPMGLTGILNDPDNYWITAMCSKSSTSNVTYATSSGSSEFKANKLWIVGNAQSSGTNTPLHSVQGIPPASVNGELIIQNFNTNGNEVLYMCYLLCVTSVAVPGGEQIDNLLNVTPSTNILTVDLNAAINSKPVNNPVYIEYKSSKLGPGSTVIVFSQPIFVTSVNLFALQNNVGLFDMPMPAAGSQPTPNSTSTTGYAIIPQAVAGQWMECDYVPIDSEEVNTFNLPIASGVVKDSSTFNSFQTIITFMVFFFICLFAYMIIPAVYLVMAYKVLGRALLGPQQKRDRIFYMDLVLSFILAGTAFILVCVGAFANPPPPNSGDILLSGFCIAIIYIIAYIIVQSKKMGGRFIEGVQYDYLQNN